jgi:PhzF family phenazine biosynthesis protein
MPKMNPESYSIVQTRVFGISKTGGNPCSIVFNADNFTDEQMQSLCAKFDSETVFVFPPISATANIRLRYFVPKYEMEMCVHATVGTVTVLFQQGLLHLSPLLIETPLGVIPAHWQYTDNLLEVLVEQFTPIFSEDNPTTAEVVCALGISETEIDDCSPIQSVSTSRPKLMIPLKNWQILDRIKPNFEELWKLCNLYQTTGFYPFTLKPRDSRFHAEARQFPNQAGYDEDPATGVAACALGAYLTHYSLLQQCSDGETNYSIGQGNAMGKDSRINVKIYVRDREITRVQVGGTAEIVADL